ncbi:MAG: hypothetical protein ACJ8AI_14590 [Rhodopila sp.]
MSSRRIELPCTVEIEQTAEYLYAYVSHNDYQVRPGDRVLVHGAPTHIPFGDRITLQTTATIIRANIFGRFWAHVTGLLSLVELYEVGFDPEEAL